MVSNSVTYNQGKKESSTFSHGVSLLDGHVQALYDWTDKDSHVTTTATLKVRGSATITTLDLGVINIDAEYTMTRPWDPEYAPYNYDAAHDGGPVLRKESAIDGYQEMLNKYNINYNLSDN